MLRPTEWCLGLTSAWSILFYSILFYSILFYSILFYSLMMVLSLIYIDTCRPPSSSSGNCSENMEFQNSNHVKDWDSNFSIFIPHPLFPPNSFHPTRAWIPPSLSIRWNVICMTCLAAEKSWAAVVPDCVCKVLWGEGGRQREGEKSGKLISACVSNSGCRELQCRATSGLWWCHAGGTVGAVQGWSSGLKRARRPCLFRNQSGGQAPDFSVDHES